MRPRAGWPWGLLDSRRLSNTTQVTWLCECQGVGDLVEVTRPVGASPSALTTVPRPESTTSILGPPMFPSGHTWPSTTREDTPDLSL